MRAYSGQDKVICFNYRHLGDSSSCRLQICSSSSSSSGGGGGGGDSPVWQGDDERTDAGGSEARSFHRVRSLQVDKLTPAANTC